LVLETGDAGEFDRMSDEELRAFIYGQEKILATLSGEARARISIEPTRSSTGC
jgi:hypothetical protein